MTNTPLTADLRARGILQELSHRELERKLDGEKLTFYVGFDPSAKSLQIGNLFILTTMMRLQKAGHRPLAVVGGATGMIGDPSGKSKERNLLDPETLEKNITGIKKELEKFLDFDCGDCSALVLNNHDWIHPLSFIDLLRSIGKHFRLNEMLAKDSVKSRLQSESGLSYTEFSYQILQAYDFAHLHQKHACQLQLGASDQWGNITAGIDLTRKLQGATVYGLITPLVTDAQGRKFGKSEGGQTVYLDAQITSPYQMYQFFINSEDSVVGSYLRYYTFLSLEEIALLEREVQEKPHLRAAQKKLAREVVRLVHGREGLESAEKASRIFFGEKIEKLEDRDIDDLFGDVPSIEMPRQFLEGPGGDLLEMLAQTPLFKSKGEARRGLQQKGVYLNNVVIEKMDLKLTPSLLASESAMIVRKGKKNYCVVKFLG